MNSPDQTLIAANIRKARTLRGIAPDDYQVAYRSFAQLMDERAAQTPDKVFLSYYNDDGGESARFTYSEFNRRANQVANLLRNRYGVRRGDKVATLAFNHPDAILTYFACWKLGAVATPQNASEDDNRIAFILQNADCKLVLARPEYVERVQTIQRLAPGVKNIVALDPALQEALDAESAEFAPPAASMLEDEALLVYTSGTTGAPKGVMLCQYNLLADAKGMAEWQGITADTRMMCVLPVHHVNGLAVTHIVPLYAGGSTVLNRAFKASTFWRRIAEEKVHIVSVVPTLLQFLCEANEDISKYDLSAFRHIICGAGTLSVALVTRFEDQFKKKVMHGYGLSETTCYSCYLPLDLTPQEHRRWLADYGYPSIGVELWPNEMAIHDPDGKALPAGDKGEIVIRGHNVMLGYFKRDDANLETFKHGWFRSGDEGFFQEDAQRRKFYFITGRLKELINRGGVKYSPFEIEEVLLRIPGVKVGLVIAFDNDWYGEEVGAYVVKEEGAALSEQDVLQACRKVMPFGKAPKVVTFGTEIPVTTTGKYQRLKLKDLFAEYRAVQFKETK